jgi:putative nucleotidyltransferase with HDIG domain
MTRDISQLILGTQFLPPAFQIVPRLLLLLDDSEEANSEKVAELIRVDPGLTADVLRVCNSAHFSGSYRAETLVEAIMRLGLREVYRVVMNVITSPIMSSFSTGHGREETNLWNHSLAVATGAKALAADKGVNVELAFTTGLIHDIGKIVVTDAAKGDYGQLIQEAAEKKRSVPSIEKEKFGMDHAEVGGRLLSRWNFSPNVIAAVRFHHNPIGAGEHKALAAVVHTANLLAFHINQGSGHDSYVRYFDQHCLDILDVTPEALEQQYAEQVKEGFLKELQFSLGIQGVS